MIWLANYVSKEDESSESDVNEEDGCVGDLGEDSDSSENNNVSSDCILPPARVLHTVALRTTKHFML